jgi:hypothetical protein
VTYNLTEHIDQKLKPLADRTSAVTKRAVLLSGRVSKGIQTGDLRQVSGAIDELAAIPARLQDMQRELADASTAFDGVEYLRTTFPAEFEAACASEGLKLEGFFPRYRIFPFDVFIDVDNLSALLNRKRTGWLRPAALARAARREKERLESARFNPTDFLQGLFHAWDNLNLRSAKRSDIKVRAAVRLKKVYQELSPMARQRRDYPESFFAFDVQRLLYSQVMEFKGYQCQLGSAKDPSGALRLLDRQGQERFISTVNFVEV